MMPSTPLPIRPRLREWLILACSLLLFSTLTWVAVVYLDRPHYAPDFQAGLDALQANNPSNARALFNQALKTDSSNPDLYLAIAEAGAQKKQWNLQLDYARLGIAQCSRATEAQRSALYTILANALTEAKPAGWQDEAIQAAKQSYDLDPKNPARANEYGYLLADLRDDPESLMQAETLITQALRDLRESREAGLLRASIAVTLDSFGWVRYKRGDLEGAVNALTEAVNTIPLEAQDAEAMKVLYYHLGVVHRAAGRTEEARSALQRSLYEDPNYAEAKEELKSLPPPDKSPPTATSSH